MLGLKKTELGRLLAAALSYGILIGMVGCLSWSFIILDTLISCLLFAGLSVMVWNVLRFTLASATEQGHRMQLLITLGAVALLIMLCLESMVMYLVFELQFRLFAATIPVRLLVLALLYIILTQKLDNGDSPCATGTVPVVQGASPLLTQLSVKCGQKLTIVQVSDIIFIKADGDYVVINTADGHYLKEQTMKYFEENLPADVFVRVHRSYIVNVKAISRIERYGEYQQLELTGGEKVRISPSGYKLLRAKLNL